MKKRGEMTMLNVELLMMNEKERNGKGERGWTADIDSWIHDTGWESSNISMIPPCTVEHAEPR